MTDARSNIFVYMTGHGGDEFLKFQDNEEISAFDIADAFGGMWAKGRCVLIRERSTSKLTRGRAGTTRSSSWSTHARPTRSTPSFTLPTSSLPARVQRMRTHTRWVTLQGGDMSGNADSRLPQHHADDDIGVAVTDRYTHHVLTVLETINKTSQVTLQNLVRCPGQPFSSPKLISGSRTAVRYLHLRDHQLQRRRAIRPLQATTV